MGIDEFPDELRPRMSREEWVEFVVGTEVTQTELDTLVTETPIELVAICGNPESGNYLALVTGHRHDLEDTLIRLTSLTEAGVDEIRLESHRFWECYDDDCNNFVIDTGPWMCATHRDRLMVLAGHNDAFIRIDELQ